MQDLIKDLSPKLRSKAESLIRAGIEDTNYILKQMTGTDDDMAILRAAIATEKSSPLPRSSRIKPMESKLEKFAQAAREKLLKANGKSSQPSTTDSQPEITTESPKDPRWDTAREISEQLRLCGRLYLRGQVRLGMVLSGLKKEFGITKGKRPSTSPDSGEVLSWPELVKRETGYSRQSCDEFIRLYEATKAKLKTAKKLDLPAPAKKDAIVLFQAENPLTLSDQQWSLVDQVIGTLTTGETQASLMQELGIVAKPKPMPTAPPAGKKTDDDHTAGQLAFHFFDAVASQLINARTNPDYQKMLLSLPPESDEEHPLSLATLEAEARALIADIEEVKRFTASAAKPARGRTINA